MLLNCLINFILLPLYSGFKVSHHTGRAVQIARLLQRTLPDKYETWFAFQWDAGYRGPEGLLTKFQSELPDGHPLKAHRTSPFVWLEFPEAADGTLQTKDGRHVLPLGGRDRFCEYLHKTLENNEKNRPILDLAAEPSFADAWVDETPGSSQQAQ